MGRSEALGLWDRLGMRQPAAGFLCDFRHVGAGDDDAAFRFELPCGVQDVSEKRAPGGLVQHLGPGGTHARSQACGEDDDGYVAHVALMIPHGSNCNEVSSR